MLQSVEAASVAQPEAQAGARSQYRRQQEQQIRPDNYDLKRYPIMDAQAKHWRNLLWTTAVVNPREPFVADALQQIIAQGLQDNQSQAQTDIIEMAMQVGTQLYVSDPTTYRAIGKRFRDLIETSSTPMWIGMAISGLAQAGTPDDELKKLRDRIQQRFPTWATNPFLYTSLRDVAERLKPTVAPPLADLLQWTIAPKQFHAYVLCHPNRHVLCRMVLKDKQGQFVRDASGNLWSVPLLLRSLHNLSWNFFRGNTPQGIYRVEGTIPQPDNLYFRAYGQFALVNLFVPFEDGAKAFLPNQKGRFTGSIEQYLELLPPSWRQHWGIQQSYWAGRIGRSLFRIHGTGEAVDFFSGKEGYPQSYDWNPTIGCLSALELYDPKGNLLQADMPKILDALAQASGSKEFSGFLIVVDLPQSLSAPISLEAIDAAIPTNQPTPLPNAAKE